MFGPKIAADSTAKSDWHGGLAVAERSQGRVRAHAEALVLLTARLLALLMAGLVPHPHRPHHHRPRRRPAPPPMRTALASWYFAGGGPIACGGDSWAMGVASRTLRCGTRIEVCFRGCVRAVVNDYGPAAWTGRSMDLSEQVARAVGFSGVATVRWRVIG